MYKLILILSSSLLAVSLADVPVQITPECKAQSIRQQELQNQCHNHIDMKRFFSMDIMEKIIELSKTDDHTPIVYKRLQKYCDIIPKLLDCFHLPLEVDDVCKVLFPHRVLKKKMLKVLRSVANYACENDGAVLKKLVPHAGLQLFFGRDFIDCFNMEEAAEDIKTFGLFLEQSMPCLEETVVDHPNKDIIVVVREVVAKFKRLAR